ncbi:hypothetical protein NVP1112O_23 [Vibrio phage 1.112.O._10N.286.46.B11]|nr:hypothetical protein NVP1112O_23 [Vibrio phage 1.112.O._10N.286.46.B11]
MKIKIFLAKYLPMEFLEYRFTDRVSGEAVSLYVQTDGKLVLSTSRFSTFRVPPPNTDLHWRLAH